jgi:hypothetical protein
MRASWFPVLLAASTGGVSELTTSTRILHDDDPTI